jgi:predicted O-methyltransferase YrrM
MIVDERLVTYINSLDRGNTPVLDEIEKEALRDFVPIIRKEMQSFLKLLLAMQKPMRILEVGTAVGFFCRFDGRVCTEGLSDSDD